MRTNYTEIRSLLSHNCGNTGLHNHHQSWVTGCNHCFQKSKAGFLKDHLRSDDHPPLEIDLNCVCLWPTVSNFWIVIFKDCGVDLVISNNWCSFAKLSVNLLSNQANSLLFYEFRKFYYEMIDLPSIYSAFKGLANAFSLHKFLKSHQSFKDMRSQISRPHTCKWASTMGTRPPICTKEGCVYTPKWHYDYKKTRKLLIRDFLTAVNLAYIKNIWKNIWE